MSTRAARFFGRITSHLFLESLGYVLTGLKRIWPRVVVFWCGQSVLYQDLANLTPNPDIKRSGHIRNIFLSKHNFWSILRRYTRNPLDLSTHLAFYQAINSLVLHKIVFCSHKIVLGLQPKICRNWERQRHEWESSKYLQVWQTCSRNSLCTLKHSTLSNLISLRPSWK